MGASSESNANARLKLEEAYPGLEIVGQDGYFEDSLKVVEHINASKADVLFVAMGSPKQEQWISQHRDAINASFCMGVGGSFDVAAGNVRRAPKIFRMTGTEFMFRIAMEPKKRFMHNWILLRFLLRVIGKRLLEKPEHEQATHAMRKPCPTGSQVLANAEQYILEDDFVEPDLSDAIQDKTAVLA